MSDYLRKALNDHERGIRDSTIAEAMEAAADIWATVADLTTALEDVLAWRDSSETGQAARADASEVLVKASWNPASGLCESCGLKFDDHESGCVIMPDPRDAELTRLRAIEKAAKAWLADNRHCGYQGLLRNILDGRGPKEDK